MSCMYVYIYVFYARPFHRRGPLPALGCADETGGDDSGQPRLALNIPARCRLGLNGQPVVPSTAESRDHQYYRSQQQPEDTAAAPGLTMKSVEAMEKLLLEQGDCTFVSGGGSAVHICA